MVNRFADLDLRPDPARAEVPQGHRIIPAGGQKPAIGRKGEGRYIRGSSEGSPRLETSQLPEHQVIAVFIRGGSQGSPVGGVGQDARVTLFKNQSGNTEVVGWNSVDAKPSHHEGDKQAQGSADLRKKG